MISLAEARVLFVATAGPRRGLPLLVQYLLFARAHAMRPLVAVPGAAQDAEAALSLGADVIDEATPALIERLRPDVVIVDDPVAAQVSGWIVAAQQVSALILDVRDLGVDAADLAAEEPRAEMAPVSVARAAQAARR
jgi:hypothetical protein